MILPLRGADLAVARLLRQLRGQDADVAGAYLAARRARSGTDRRIGDTGRRAAQDGRLRLPPLLAADVSRSVRVDLIWLVFGLSMVAVVYTSLVALVQSGHEEADRLFVGSPYGDRDASPVRVQPPGARRRSMVVMLSHGLVSGGPVPVRRRDLRPAAHPRDRPLRRAGDQHAQICDMLFMLFTMASIGLPGTSGFVGEFLSLVGLYEVNELGRDGLRPPASFSAQAICSISIAAVAYGELVQRGRCKAMPDLSASGKSRCCCTDCRRRDVDGRLSRKLHRADPRRRRGARRPPRPALKPAGRRAI
jgi:hypothetical protein